MVTDLVLELDYPFLHISALEDVYINPALYKCFLLTYLLLELFHVCHEITISQKFVQSSLYRLL